MVTFNKKVIARDSLRGLQCYMRGSTDSQLGRCLIWSRPNYYSLLFTFQIVLVKLQLQERTVNTKLGFKFMKKYIMAYRVLGPIMMFSS